MLLASLHLRTRLVGWLLPLALCALPSMAQTGGDPSSSAELRQSVTELQQQIRELQAAVNEIRQESAQYRAETQALRSELDTTRAELRQNRSAQAEVSAAELQATPPTPDVSAAQATQPSANRDRLAKLEEEYQLLSGKVDDQYQTKVESASKYRVRFSGIVLLNLFNNQGSVDNIDFPSLALQPPPGFSGGSFGGTLRQSQLGFAVSGPRFLGARTAADLQFDFAGGFPNAPEGINTGLLRLRTGTMRLDWANSSIVAGQDVLFFSPLTPTSFASLATPALAYAGNLWNWVPQVRVEHRFVLSEESGLTVQGGILDPISGEPPPNEYYRKPQAGELSRQPAIATRLAWTHSMFGQPLTLGAGGYYSAQDYGFGRTVDGWAGTADWDIPFGSHLALSGEFFRGRALGGLGGGIGRSVMFSDSLTDPAASVLGLDSIGGWSQLKLKATPRLEFNAAFGQDNPYADDIRYFPYGHSYLNPALVRNRGTFGNVIFRPRSDLLLSAEYQHLRTFTIDNNSRTADHINLMMGILF